jgi:glucokinase
MSLHLGLDLGGTNIKVCVLASADDGAPTVVHTTQGPTCADQGPTAVVERLAELAHQAISDVGDVVSMGVGVPGRFNASDGTIDFFPNLPGPWPGTPVRGLLSEAVGPRVPVSLINDARAFTLAESTLGAAAGTSTAVCIVLGTGIGAGAVIDGRLLYGRHGRAGELGHQVVLPGGPLCGCGNRGCLEAVATSSTFAFMAGRPTAHEAAEAARRGDQRALAALDTVADYLGLAIANAVTVFCPERVVIGGGIAEAGDMLMDRLRSAADRHQTWVDHSWYEVMPAALGPTAGAVGAALWGLQSAASTTTIAA